MLSGGKTLARRRETLQEHGKGAIIETPGGALPLVFADVVLPTSFAVWPLLTANSILQLGWELLMRVTVELFGYPRQLAGEKEAAFDLSEEAHMRDVLVRLGERFPALLGPVIAPQTYELTAPYLLNIDGRRVVSDFDMRPEDGQHLLLFFVDAGG